jgi:hypothetical protein
MDLKNKLNVLIGLDLSEMDDSLIKYVELLTQLLPISYITFLHNIKQTELPEIYKSSAKMEILCNHIKNKLTDSIAFLHTPSCPYDIEVTFADYTELSFTKVSERLNINLVVLGNKQNLEGNGGLSHKLIRMLPSATLLVPETYNPHPIQVIEAVDFSKHSNTVIQWGSYLEKFNRVNPLNIQPLYVSKVAWQFFPGLSPAEIQENTELDTRKSMAKWARLYPELTSLKVIPANDKNIASSLMQYVKQHQIDLVIMGVQGMTSLTTLFMGSVTNEVLQLEVNACLLLVKHTARDKDK